VTAATPGARRNRRVGALARLGAAFVLLAWPSVARASRPREALGCEPASARVARASPDAASGRARVWPEPLDRVLSLDVGDVDLRSALDRIAADARVRVSYSPEVVPVARRVCLSFQQTTLGDVLVTLLDGSGVAPVVIGADQIVLAPSRAAVGADATPARARDATHLERVVVTGTATGGAERASPFALTVIDGRSLSPSSMQSMSSVFDGAIPGVWLWAQSPASVVARYGSLRGASSFGVSTPKVYIDGIEAANPLMVTQLDPSSIERIEVIRGPQGAALYGSDAISGVVQIVTRHDGVDADSPTTDVRVSAGSSTSSYATGGILAQEHGVTVRHGAAANAASLGLSVSTLGAYTPGADAQQVMASGSVRHVGSRAIVTGTLRMHATNTDVPASPLLSGLLTGPSKLADSTPQRVRQYTLGTSATFQASEQWTHALTAGIDGYRLSGMSAASLPLPSSTDSALRAARGGADRMSLRLSSTRRFASPETNGVLLTFGAEHSTAREQTSGLGTQLASRSWVQSASDTSSAPRTQYTSSDDANGVTWWHNTGVLTQAQVALNGSLFLTGGARLEHISGPATASQFALLPLLGASWVAGQGPVTMKLRAAYGRGIRPARTVARGGTWMGGHESRSLNALAPEEQAGTELGVDAMWGEHLSLNVTRFDQRASGLVQPVALLDYGSFVSGPGPGGSTNYQARVLYQLQNVGAIDNRGWEMQAKSSLGPLAVGATLSLVSSRVARLATGYLGDLREGDRMLEVPARTMGLNATWSASRWTTTGTVSRAADWVNYDELSLAKAIAADSTGMLVPVGRALRAYWRDYEGSTRVSLRTAFALRAHTWINLSGENLLNRQIGEPDNVTVVPGRTITLGLRTAF